MQYLLGAQCEQIFVKADVCFLLSPEISFVLKFCCKEIIKKHKKSTKCLNILKCTLNTHSSLAVGLRWYKFYWFLSLNIIFVKWIGHIWGKDKTLGFLSEWRIQGKLIHCYGKSGFENLLICEGSLNSDDHVFICELCHWALVY